VARPVTGIGGQRQAVSRGRRRVLLFFGRQQLKKLGAVLVRNIEIARHVIHHQRAPAK